MTDYEYWTTQQVTSSKKYPFSKGQFQHLLLHRHKNGLNTAVRKVGKRLLVRIDLLDQWIEEHREGKNG